jgi:putative transcriptional regulator
MSRATEVSATAGTPGFELPARFPRRGVGCSLRRRTSITRSRERPLARSPMESARGQLLIAGPTLLDPNFWRTVVLVIEHSDDGALGLVLNRPSETTVGDAVPQLQDLVDLDEQLFVGGPVQPSAVIVLAEFEDPAEAALIAFGEIGVLGTGFGPEQLVAGVRAGRAFVGHAGWGPAQLDSELERGDWILEPARREDAFCRTPQELWSGVLTRKGGSYALVARMPTDPSVN